METTGNLMAAAIIWLVFFTIMHILGQRGIMLIDRYRKNLGKKIYKLKGVSKCLIVRSSYKLDLSKLPETRGVEGFIYEVERPLWIKNNGAFKNQVSSLSLLLQILSHILFITATVLLLLGRDVLGIVNSKLPTAIGMILSLIHLALLFFAFVPLCIFYRRKIDLHIREYIDKQDDTVAQWSSLVPMKVVSTTDTLDQDGLVVENNNSDEQL